MKVTVERAELLKSLGHVHRVVERRNTIPILANVLVRAEKSALSLKATDLDLEVIESIAAEVEPAGSTTVPAHMFYEIVRKLPEGVAGRAGILRATAPCSRSAPAARASRLQTLPESDFPDLAAGDMTHKFALAGGRSQAPDRQDPVRHLDRGDALLSQRHLSAHRRHRQILPPCAPSRPTATGWRRPICRCPAGAAGMPGIIVPRKTVTEVQRLIEDNRRPRSPIELSPAKIRFSIGDVVLTSKLIDGTFPDYARVIPTGNDKELVVDKKDFEAAVDRVSTVSSERGRAVKLSLSGGKLILSVTNPDSGSATEELEVEYDADPLDIGFNSRYLLDIAAQTRGRGGGAQARRSRLADADPGQGRQGRALRADADAGVIRHHRAPTSHLAL